MIKTNLTAQTQARKITQQVKNFSVIEYMQDISVDYATASTAYYASKMNVHKKQVVIELAGTGAVLQAGAMQMILGNIESATNIKGAGDFAKKLIGSKVTGETAVKPKYTGSGTLVLEPTYKYILLEDMAEWGGGFVIEDGLFLACSDTVDMKVIPRSNVSSALLGGEGLFSTNLRGTGVVALESPVPREELIEIELDNDTVKIDGNMAIAWTEGLQFTVEKTTKTLIGSAASGEGFVNVYRGSGKILVAPVNKSLLLNVAAAVAQG